MKKKIVLSLLVIVSLFMITGCGKDKEYRLNICKLDDISSITIDTLAQEDNVKEFNNKTSIEEIYNVFSDKTTRTESINDSPYNPDILYIVKFNTFNGDSKSAYIYKKENRYYIEQPYNGIYRITEKEYNSIEKFVK